MLGSKQLHGVWCAAIKLLPLWLTSPHVTGYYTNDDFWKLLTWSTQICMHTCACTHTQTNGVYLYYSFCHSGVYLFPGIKATSQELADLKIILHEEVKSLND